MGRNISQGQDVVVLCPCYSWTIGDRYVTSLTDDRKLDRRQESIGYLSSELTTEVANNNNNKDFDPKQVGQVVEPIFVIFGVTSYFCNLFLK